MGLVVAYRLHIPKSYYLTQLRSMYSNFGYYKRTQKKFALSYFSVSYIHATTFWENEVGKKRSIHISIQVPACRSQRKLLSVVIKLCVIAMKFNWNRRKYTPRKYIVSSLPLHNKWPRYIWLYVTAKGQVSGKITSFQLSSGSN